MNTPPLTTERLILRRFEGGDLPALLLILGDREANRRAKVAGQRLWAARVGFAFPKGHPLEKLNSLSICSEPPWL